MRSGFLEAGESVLAKPNVLHGMENMSDEVCRCYEVKFTISAPPGWRRCSRLSRPFFPRTTLYRIGPGAGRGGTCAPSLHTQPLSRTVWLQ